MTPPDLSDAELTRFGGIVLADEHPHPFSPEQEWWNESYFWDWYDATGRTAGHCRIGWHPNQQRLWIWVFLWNGDEWIAIEEPRLPFAALPLPAIRYESFGLTVTWAPSAPLRRGRFAASGFGRVLCGRRAGMILPLAVELDVAALGAAHSVGGGQIAGHSDATYATNRFEQPIAVAGWQEIAGERIEFTGRGERDHSWGPRWWNIEWTFLVVNGESLRLQAAHVRIPEVTELQTGYLHRGATGNLTGVEFQFAWHDDRVTHPFDGRVVLTADDGTTIAGRVEPLTAAEIDLTHTFVPPRRSVYRRALVRFTPDGAAPVLGWLEANRFA